MPARVIGLAAAAGSLGLLLGAFAFQHIGGLAPCPICLWQRWPHAAAILLGALLLIWPARIVYALGALTAATTGALGIYHTGIERKWWAGPTSCTGSGDTLSGLSGTDLLSMDSATPLVMCDQISWEMLGLSMPSWNAVASFVFMALWLVALRRA
ncbi:disulfide bond formation protein B [Fluviibacterium sp. DFM31]|uniref:Disulfide bond formation protein B n=1 Tax=Meridianimarinicoccus marinus TaxID=3231483 RepID=A0ABV3L1S2_9RHOB